MTKHRRTRQASASPQLRYGIAAPLAVCLRLFGGRLIGFVVPSRETKNASISTAENPPSGAQNLLTDVELVNGGEGQNRTVDTTIFSRMLYQLSYLATPGERVRHGQETRAGERR